MNLRGTSKESKITDRPLCKLRRIGTRPASSAIPVRYNDVTFSRVRDYRKIADVIFRRDSSARNKNVRESVDARDFVQSPVLSTSRSRVIDTNDNYKCPTRSFTRKGNTESRTHGHDLDDPLRHLARSIRCGCGIAYVPLYGSVCTLLHGEHSAHC